MDSDEQTASVLTPSQREYLRGKADLGARGRRAAQSRIRDRVATAMEDFSLLVAEMPPEQREQVFEQYGEGGPFQEGVMATLTFLFLGLADLDHRAGRTNWRNRAFDSALRLGVEDACEELGMLVAKWELEYTTVSAEQRDVIKERLKEGYPFGPQLVALLWQDGELDRDRLREFLLKELETPAD